TRSVLALVHLGVPFECIHSVPPGHLVRIDQPRGTTTLQRFTRPAAPSEDADAPLRDLARAIRLGLDRGFRRLADQFRDRRVHVCVSGGLDSGIIAALAREYFTDVTGYTYTFSDGGTPPSEDAIYAERLAGALRIPLRM